MLIVCGGVIGAGKTSLAGKLAKSLHSKPFYEPVKNNPVLPKFYQGNQLVSEGKWSTNHYAFLLQIYFLNLRFRMIKQAMSNDNNVMDRSIYEDSLFMRMNYDLGTTTKEEWDVYRSLLANMMQELPYAAHKKAPDLMVYLRVSLPTELKRIKIRGRAYEQISTHPNLLGYYKNLQKYYKRWYKSYHYSPKMMVDGDKYDFVHNSKDLHKILSMVKNKLDEVRK